MCLGKLTLHCTDNRKNIRNHWLGLIVIVASFLYKFINVFVHFQVANAKEQELSDLLEILDCFFDPEKKPVQPKPRFFPNQSRRPRYNSKREKDNRDKNGNSQTSEATVGDPKGIEEVTEQLTNLNLDQSSELEANPNTPATPTATTVVWSVKLVPCKQFSLVVPYFC